MAPPNRARQYGGGRGGFDLGALLLGVFGNGGAEELNPDFGGDEESIRAERGDYKSEIDTENPYKKGNWANRMLGGQGSAKNAEFKINQIEQARQQEFLRDMEKVKLAGELTRIGATTEAEKMLMGVKQKYAAELENLQNTNQLGQIEKKGQVDIKTDKKQSKNRLRELIKGGEVTKDVNLSRQTGEANMGFGRFPGSKVTPEFEELADSAARKGFELKPKMMETELAKQQGLAATSGYIPVSEGNALFNAVSPSRDVSILHRPIPANPITGQGGRQAQMSVQPTQILKPPTQATADAAPSPVSLLRPTEVGQQANPEVMENQNGTRMLIKPSGREVGNGLLTLPPDSDTLAKRLRARRQAEELLGMLGNESQLSGQWPPR